MALGRSHLVVLLMAAAVFWPQLTKVWSENFNTGHFSEEVESRKELNDLAGRMIDDHPVLGVGLNNFELVMGPYEKYGIIFFDNPVHNVYLLYLSETGVVGLAGVILVGVGMYNVALRLSRSRDRLLGGVGLGVSGAMGFLMVEELLGFSLRQDIPLIVYWLLAGLAVACFRMAGFEGSRRSVVAPPAQRPRRRSGLERIRRERRSHQRSTHGSRRPMGAFAGSANGHNGNGNGHATVTGVTTSAGIATTRRRARRPHERRGLEPGRGAEARADRTGGPERPGRPDRPGRPLDLGDLDELARLADLVHLADLVALVRHVDRAGTLAAGPADHAAADWPPSSGDRSPTAPALRSAP